MSWQTRAEITTGIRTCLTVEKGREEGEEGRRGEGRRGEGRGRGVEITARLEDIQQSTIAQITAKIRIHSA